MSSNKFQFGTMITCQVLSCDVRDVVNRETGEVTKQYGVIQLLSVNVPDKGMPVYAYFDFFAEPESVDKSMIGKVVSVAARSYADRKTGQLRWVLEDGARLLPRTDLPAICKLDPDLVPVEAGGNLGKPERGAAGVGAAPRQAAE
ncbi:hypothetical protein ACM64Y_01860 [Novispirillum sp. DQ9]|uniref:hypothetical protein n=1 Tax=Novispirillum sp. DQ9 TaxID=3398612 RepID=UPI003C7E92BD